jgi:hypothetical protein
MSGWVRDVVLAIVHESVFVVVQLSRNASKSEESQNS